MPPDVVFDSEHVSSCERCQPNDVCTRKRLPMVSSPLSLLTQQRLFQNKFQGKLGWLEPPGPPLLPCDRALALGCTGNMT